MMLRAASYKTVEDDVVFGESRPLSELLLIAFEGSSTAAIHIRRSSSGTKIIIIQFIVIFKNYLQKLCLE